VPLKALSCPRARMAAVASRANDVYMRDILSDGMTLGRRLVRID